MEKYTPLIRLLIQAGAGALATRGFIKDADMAAFIDAAMAASVMALTGLWSYIEKNQIKTAALRTSSSMDTATITALSAELEQLRKENSELKSK
jgi:hypothetical protein